MQSGNDIIVKIGNDSVILKNVAGENVNILVGKSPQPNGLILSGTSMIANRFFKGKSIDLTKYSKVKTLDASAVTQKLKITGNALANTIKGGRKNDTIYGGKGNDSINITYGDNVIYGDSGNDTLSCDLYDASHNTIYGGSGNDRIDVVYSSFNKIYGGTGNDTLISYSHDTLTGGKGKDVFVTNYSNRDVTITDYTAGQDKIKISSGLILNSYVNNKDVIFMLGTETTSQSYWCLTVKNGKGKKITVIDQNDNETTQIYGSASANVAELFAENNFATADNLSEIVKNNLTATDYKIEANNFENLTQKNNLITFADK